jgi:uncharacterized protein
MEHFTPLTSTLGGVLIGLASAAILLFHGRIAGVSGICGSLFGALRGELGWRLGFLLGLIGVGAVGVVVAPSAFDTGGTGPLAGVALAGVLVGFGTRLGNGCTSGHGVCGISRLSPRSFAATGVFMITAAATVFVVRHLVGGGA